MKIRIYRTNRKVSESPYLTACKEQNGLLGNIEMNHITNVADILDDHSEYYVSAGENVKRLKGGGWMEIAYELQKPGVFDKLARFFKK